jgi:transposase
MMEKIIKTNVGLDISMETFWATITVSNHDYEIRHIKSSDFSNDEKGYKKMEEWLNQTGIEFNDLHFTMEATGVYYEIIANYLYNKKYLVHVVLPNKAKKYAESLDNKSKNDKLDSKVLGRLGVERKLTIWKPADPFYKELKELTREREGLIKMRSTYKNRRHALKHSYQPNPKTVLRVEESIDFLEKKGKEVETDINILLKNNPEKKEKIDLLVSIPGIGVVTAATIAAETDGFAMILNSKQLTSYAGLDVVERTSGKFKGKTKISKKGNSHIRGALYLPSISTITHSEQHKFFYNRIITKKEKAKIGITAVSRKLLVLMYSLWKNNAKYEENYQSKKNENKVA